MDGDDGRAILRGEGGRGERGRGERGRGERGRRGLEGRRNFVATIFPRKSYFSARQIFLSLFTKPHPLSVNQARSHPDRHTDLSGGKGEEKFSVESSRSSQSRVDGVNPIGRSYHHDLTSAVQTILYTEQWKRSKIEIHCSALDLCICLAEFILRKAS